MHVLEGQGIITIAKKQEPIHSGTSIIIPKSFFVFIDSLLLLDNVYNIQNVSKSRFLRIFFVISEIHS